MVSSDKTKEVLNDWGNAFPNLSKYSSSVLLMKLDVVLIGLSLERLPRCEKYRPLLICYPLWTLNENLHESVFMWEMHNRKNLQLNIPYEDHHSLFPEATEYTRKQVGLLLQEKVLVKDIFELLKLQFADVLIKSSPIAQAKLLEYKFFITLFFNDFKLISDVKNEIVKVSKTWNPELFEWKYGKIEDWYTRLFEKVNNRNAFMEQIHNNLSEKKISGLKVAQMLL